MFAIPGLAALLLFVYLRPQEIFEPLAALTFVMVLSPVVLGMVLDWRLGVSGPRRNTMLVLAGAFFGWAMLTAVIRSPDRMTFLVAITVTAVAMYLLISQTVQSFRALETLAGLILAISLLLAFVGVHQGLSPPMCIVRNGVGEVGHGNVLTDGRTCTTVEDCERDKPDPESEFRCDHIGMLGTSAIGGRVRYRGILQDPNELAWVISLSIPLAFTFFERRKTVGRFVLLAVTFALVMSCVVLTKSRSGQLTFLVVAGAYFIRRFRWRGAVVGAVLALPLLLLGGRSGAEAESSSVERLECWQAGIEMWKGAPLMGVGYGNFGEHHFLTAHNSFVLTLAEVGPLGLLLWTSLMYFALKVLVTALREFSHKPEAAVAARWAMALLAAMLGTTVSSFFLSIAYHALLWVNLALVASYYSAVRRHSPGWTVRFGWKDIFLVGSFDTMLISAIYVYIKLKGV